MEMIRFSSSMSVRVTTASVRARPSLSSTYRLEPSAWMTVALGSTSASSSQRSSSISMSFTSTPVFSSSMAR